MTSVKVKTADLITCLDAAAEVEIERVKKIQADWPKQFEAKRAALIKELQSTKPNERWSGDIRPPDEITKDYLTAEDPYNWRTMSKIKRLKSMLEAETREVLTVSDSSELAGYLRYLPKK